jgi:hypothetical protein
MDDVNAGIERDCRQALRAFLRDRSARGQRGETHEKGVGQGRLGHGGASLGRPIIGRSLA